MNRNFVLCLSLVSAMGLSGCNLFGYTAAVCNSENSVSLTDLNATYDITLSVPGQGDFQGGSGVAVDTSKPGRLSLPSSDGDTTELVTCQVGGKILAEGSATPNTMSEGTSAYLITRNENGFTMELIEYDVNEMKKLTTVESVTIEPKQGGMIDFPITIHVADNSELSAENFVKQFQPSTQLKIIFNKN